jgi:hypothetical protein
MTFDEYKAIQAINATSIRAGARSMLAMRAKMTAQPDKDNDTLRWGRLVHAAIESESIIDRLEVWSGKRRDGAAWDLFENSLSIRDYFNGEKERANLIECMAAIRNNPHAAPLLERRWTAEQVVTWSDPDCGRCKARLDALSRKDAPPAVLEVKTTRNIDERAFGKQFSDLGYHLQLGWYWRAARVALGIEDGCDLPTVTTLVIESQSPWDCAVIEVPSDVIRHGYETARQIAAEYRRCEAAGVFPGRYWKNGATLVLPPSHGQLDAVDMEGCDNE